MAASSAFIERGPIEAMSMSVSPCIPRTDLPRSLNAAPLKPVTRVHANRWVGQRGVTTVTPVHADAVVDVEVFTRFVKHGYGVARIGAEVNPHVGELRSQGLHHTRHIEVRAECCMGGAVQQHGQHHVIVLIARTKY